MLKQHFVFSVMHSVWIPPRLWYVYTRLRRKETLIVNMQKTRNHSIRLSVISYRQENQYLDLIRCDHDLFSIVETLKSSVITSEYVLESFPLQIFIYSNKPKTNSIVLRLDSKSTQREMTSSNSRLLSIQIG